MLLNNSVSILVIIAESFLCRVVKRRIYHYYSGRRRKISHTSRGGERNERVFSKRNLHPKAINWVYFLLQDKTISVFCSLPKFSWMAKKGAEI